MGERGKKKFTFTVGYKDYLEKTIRAHGNCTLFNARNRGTFSRVKGYFIRIFSLLDSHRARTFFLFNSLVFHNYLRIAG